MSGNRILRSEEDLFLPWFKSRMKTSDLFSFPPATHRHDPVTSHLAEQQVTESGERESDAEFLLKVVRNQPNRTGSEYAALLGWELYRVRRRLSDLKGDKRLAMGPKRLCRGRRVPECEWRCV